MDDLRAPQKWRQNVYIAPLWLAAVYIVHLYMSMLRTEGFFQFKLWSSAPTYADSSDITCVYVVCVLTIRLPGHFKTTHSNLLRHRRDKEKQVQICSCSTQCLKKSNLLSLQRSVNQIWESVVLNIILSRELLWKTTKPTKNKLHITLAASMFTLSRVIVPGNGDGLNFNDFI